MPTLLKSRRARIVVIVAAVSLLLWWPAAYPRGMVMACLDHACGHHEVLVYGLVKGPLFTSNRLLWERYGVETHLGGCVVTPWEDWYAEGYNAVSRRLLIWKYGRDIFSECHGEAERRWQAEHPDP
jgi:hypothetical protein